jgi:hypothetical protein
MKYRFVILHILGFLLLGCSPQRKINMKNASGDAVEITWTLKELDSLYLSPFFISNSRTVKFELKPQKPYDEVKMSFGMGSWPKDTLAIITDRLESLEIKSANGTILLNSSKDIYSFLYNRRKGMGNRKIEILITK